MALMWPRVRLLAPRSKARSPANTALSPRRPQTGPRAANQVSLHLVQTLISFSSKQEGDKIGGGYISLPPPGYDPFPLQSSHSSTFKSGINHFLNCLPSLLGAELSGNPAESLSLSLRHNTNVY